MRKFPNASILSIITRDVEDGVFDLLFISVKSVPDYFNEPNPYWYEGKGKKGSASIIWQNLKVRQWFACGKDEDIHKLYDEVLLAGIITIDSVNIKLNLPKFIKDTLKLNPSFDESQDETENLITEDLEYFPQQFRQKENLQILSGYKPSSESIKPFFPIGLYYDNFIYQHIKEGRFGIREFRQPYLTFHGVLDSVKKTDNIEAMTGFYQENFVTECKYTVVFKNISRTDIGRSLINQSNELFYTDIIDTSGKGTVTIIINDLAVIFRKG